MKHEIEEFTVKSSVWLMLGRSWSSVRSAEDLGACHRQAAGSRLGVFWQYCFGFAFVLFVGTALCFFLPVAVLV